jgi:hypothetical protein
VSKTSLVEDDYSTSEMIADDVFNPRVTKLYFATTSLCWALITPRSNFTWRHEMPILSHYSFAIKTRTFMLESIPSLPFFEKNSD